jgi:hypothetical protein
MSNTTPTISAANKSRKAQLTIRPSDERGFADHDWLKVRHGHAIRMTVLTYR